MPGDGKDRTPRSNHEFGFAVAIDDDLLAAALASVEAVSAGRDRPPRDDEEESFSGDVEVEPPDGEDAATGEVVIPVSEEDETSRGFHDRSEGDGAAEIEVLGDRLDFAYLTEEWSRLQAEVDRARAQLSEVEDKLRAEVQERRRAAGAVRRLTAQVERAEAVAREAEEARRAAEEAARLHREAAEDARSDLARLVARRKAEVAEQQKYGHGRALGEVLPVLDHLEMAANHDGADPERVVTGIRMIVEQFRSALGRLGVTRVDASPGTPFQPEVHEAMMEVPSDLVEPGRVASELSSGYRLHDRLLRPARVAVASAPATGAGGSGEAAEPVDPAAAAPDSPRDPAGEDH